MITAEFTLAEHGVLKYVLDLELCNAIKNVQSSLGTAQYTADSKHIDWLKQDIEYLNVVQSLYEKLLGTIPVGFGLDNLKLQINAELKV